MDNEKRSFQVATWRGSASLVLVLVVVAVLLLLATAVIAYISFSRKPNTSAIVATKPITADTAPSSDGESTKNAEPAKAGVKDQNVKPTTVDDKIVVSNAEDEVVEFLATRTMLEGTFRPGGAGTTPTLKPHFIDWLALGVNEPLNQRIAVALVVDMRGTLKDKKVFDGTYTKFVPLSVKSGFYECDQSKELLGESKDFSKAFLELGNEALASDVSRELITSVGSDLFFDSELAGYAARTVSMISKLASSQKTNAYSDLRKAIRVALAKHPDLAESLKRNIGLAVKVRPSHERVGKLIRAASTSDNP